MFDPNSVDGQFYNRADAHINLSNQQARIFPSGPTTESMIYASSRFAAWLISTTATSRADLETKSVAGMDRYTQMFRDMLEQNMQDHINRYDDATKSVK